MTKSISMYPMIFRSLQAVIILAHSSLSTIGSTDVCGNDRPQQEYSENVWMWSPLDNMRADMSGSMRTLTVRAVKLSLGGCASKIPPWTINTEIKVSHSGNNWLLTSLACLASKSGNSSKILPKIASFKVMELWLGFHSFQKYWVIILLREPSVWTICLHIWPFPSALHCSSSGFLQYHSRRCHDHWTRRLA